MASDRWMIYASIITKEEMSVDDFLSGILPRREDDALVVSTLKSGSGREIHHLFRSDGTGSGSISSYIYEHTEDDGVSWWGMFIDSSGVYPRKLGADVLSAVGLDHGTFSDKVSVRNSLGLDISTGESPNLIEAIESWVKDGIGLFVLLNTVGGAPTNNSERSRIVSDFYASVVPLVEIADAESRDNIERMFGFRIPNDSITIVSRVVSSGIVHEGSFSRRDKASGRRIAKTISEVSARMSGNVLADLNFGAQILGDAFASGSEPEPDHEHIENVNVEDLRRHIATVEAERDRAREDARAARKEVFVLQREIDLISESGKEPESEIVPEEPGDAEIVAPVDTIRAFSESHAHLQFDTFSELEKYARVALEHVVIREGAMAPASLIESDNRSRAWKTATWSALLALNEYGASLKEGGSSLNFYEFLKSQENPLVSPRRVAMRDSDGVRKNPKLMSERSFVVDGERYEMEAHYKVDASGRHPAPRMHFIESDGRVLVGYVGKHLRTFGTN